MATKLVCEICGGKLIGKPGGVFECDSCGMEYDTTWVKAKINENTDTVKIEATSEVQSSEKVVKKHIEEVRKQISVAKGIITASDCRTVGHSADGTVLVAGEEIDGQYYPDQWTNIVAIAKGWFFTIGLKTDGTVVTEGSNANGECNVSDWANISAVAAGMSHTVGLHMDGTVVAAGNNENRECDVADWRDIVEIAAGNIHTVGLLSNGTVVAVGSNSEGQCDVSGWKNIVAIAAGARHTIGLHADGTVVAVGDNDAGQCNVSSWNNIIQVAAGAVHTVGLCKNGTVVATGDNDEGQCDVSTWKLFNSFDALLKDINEAEEPGEGARKEAGIFVDPERLARKFALMKEQSTLNNELSTLKGLFSGKRRKEIEARLAQIDAELKKPND